MKRNSFIIIFVILIFQSCATLTGAERELYSADSLFNESKYDEAITGYKKVISDYPNTHAAAEAQFSIGYALVYYDNPGMDYSQALEEFDTFIKLYPYDNLVYEAKNWYSILKTLNDTIKDNVRLNSNIEQLKQLDIRREKMSR
jgi:outer membrane protein assembly factor BamD (BamD/ComL family)